MDIKDAIFSTLQELQAPYQESTTVQENKPKQKIEPVTKTSGENILQNDPTSFDEIEYLKSVRERLLVLFEGMQSPNNRNLEKKVDMIVNFLEFMLASIDERLGKIQ